MKQDLPRSSVHLIFFIFMSIVLFLHSELQGLSITDKIKRLFWISMMVLFFVVQFIELNYLAR